MSSPRTNNRGLIEHLTRVRNEYREQGAEKNKYRIGAYNKVIKQLQELHRPVHSFDDLSSIEGIGESIANQINLYFEQNKEKKLTPDDVARAKLMTVHGIGEKKADRLIAAGIRNVAQLKNNEERLHEEGLIHGKHLIALKYIDYATERIPREEMEQHEEILLNTAEMVDPKLIVSVVGSYRRGTSTSGDVDTIVSHPTDNMKSILDYIERLVEDGYIIDTLAFAEKELGKLRKLPGPRKFLGYCQIDDEDPRRIDILFSPINELPFAELYFTGSKDYNRNMRAFAKEKGYSLSEHGLEKLDGTYVKTKFKTEKDIFEFLGYPYDKPTDRNV